MKLNKEQAMDILDKFYFFQGQRAGRELWNDKPFEVQEQDIANFSRDVALIKSYIKELSEENEWQEDMIVKLSAENVMFLSEKKKLTTENEAISKRYAMQVVTAIELDKQVQRLTGENERLRANNKQLVNDNAELKNQIQEEIAEEDINLFDEFSKLLHEGIREAKADTVEDIKTGFAMRFGTYTDKDMTPIAEVFHILDQIAKEILEE